MLIHSLWPSDVTPYGDIGLGEHWLRWWLAAWRHQAITWTNVDLSSLGICGTQMRFILIHQFVKWVWRIPCEITSTSPRDQWVNSSRNGSQYVPYLIQQDYLRRLQYRSSDSHTLFFTTTQFQATFAHPGAITWSKYRSHLEIQPHDVDTITCMQSLRNLLYVTS